MNIKKVVLLTGFAGFIGSQILKDLLYKGYKVIGMDNFSEGSDVNNFKDTSNFDYDFTYIKQNIEDLTKQEVLDMLGDVQCSHLDYIISCAAASHVDRCYDQIDKFISSNVNGPINLAKIALELKVEKFVQVSSVVGTTPILIRQNGKTKLENIEDLEKYQNYEVLTVDKDGKVFFAPVEGWVKHPVPEVYKISYIGGEISTSASHSVFVFNEKGWEEKEVRKLKIGDNLVTFCKNKNINKDFDITFDYTSDIFKMLPCHKTLSTKNIIEKVSLTYDLLWVIGFYIAEGCSDKVGEKSAYRVCFTQKDKNVLLKVKNILNQTFGNKVDISIKEKETCGASDCITSRYIIHKFFSQFGHNSDDKCIPSWFWDLSRKQIEYFLDGYSLGDGYVKKNLETILTSKTYNLIMQVNWLLRFNGYSTRVFKRLCKNNKGVFSKEEKDVWVYDIALCAKNFRETNTSPLCQSLPRSFLDKTKIYKSDHSLISKEKLFRVEKDSRFLGNDIGCATIKKIERINLTVSMYDLVVPQGGQAFFGGTSPVLLHNTDEVWAESQQPFTEETPIKTGNAYASSKASAELFLHNFCKAFGLPLVITCGANTYGQNQAIEKMIPKSIYNIVNGVKIPLYKTRARRMWLSVSDHSSGVILAMEKGVIGEKYCLAPEIENELFTDDLIRKICSVCNVSFDNVVEFVPDRPNYDLRYWMLNTKAKEDLGWYPLKAIDIELPSIVQSYYQKFQKEINV